MSRVALQMESLILATDGHLTIRNGQQMVLDMSETFFSLKDCKHSLSLPESIN